MPVETVTFKNTHEGVYWKLLWKTSLAWPSRETYRWSCRMSPPNRTLRSTVRRRQMGAEGRGLCAEHVMNADITAREM